MGWSSHATRWSVARGSGNSVSTREEYPTRSSEASPVTASIPQQMSMDDTHLYFANGGWGDLS